jgi:hypothetical protein
MRTQVTFDCADPNAQAAFWAGVFHGAVEDHVMRDPEGNEFCLH